VSDVHRILVTGATGMLGRTLLPALAQAGNTVIALGHSEPAQRAADLTDRHATHAVLDAAAPDTVVNLVALTNVDECEDNPDRAYRLNAGVVENLASWRGFAGKCHLVQISTDQIYDGAGPHDETSITVLNMYAMTKYAGELAAQRVPATIVRTNFFGPSAHPARRSFSDWILDNLRRKAPFSVFDDVLFSPLSMATLSRLLGLVIRARRPGVFNLGSHDGLSKADFAAHLARRAGFDPATLTRATLADLKLRARRPKDMRMECAAFERAFGVKLPSLREEIDQVETRS
jgi:dTDP-4-dehydrorhamnose reductase